MGLFHPLAQENGFFGLNFTALICNRNSAIFSAGSSRASMPRKYEVWIDGRPLLVRGEASVPAGFQQVFMKAVSTSADVSAALDEWRVRPEAEALVLHGCDAERIWELFRELYVFVQAAGGCVTDERGRLLAIRRLGVWDLPKGKVDAGEAIDDAALREVREECGLVTLEPGRKLCETWHTYERKGRRHLKRTDWYLMRGNSHDPLVAQADEDITEVRWLDPAEVKAMRAATYPSLRQVLDVWGEAVR